MKYIRSIDGLFTAFFIFTLTSLILSFGNQTTTQTTEIIVSGPIVIMGGGGDIEYSLLSTFEEMERKLPHMALLSPLMTYSLEVPSIRGLQVIRDSMSRVRTIRFDYSEDPAQMISFDGSELTLYFKLIEDHIDADSSSSYFEFWVDVLVAANPILFRNNGELATRFATFYEAIHSNVAQVEFDGETIYSYVFDNSLSREPSVVIVDNRIKSLKSSINDRIGCSDRKEFVILSQQLRASLESVSLILSLQVSCGGKLSFQTVSVNPLD